MKHNCSNLLLLYVVSDLCTHTVVTLALCTESTHEAIISLEILRTSSLRFKTIHHELLHLLFFNFLPASSGGDTSNTSQERKRPDKGVVPSYLHFRFPLRKRKKVARKM